MKKKIKSIISISIVVIVIAVGIATLILGLVPVGSNEDINLPNRVYIYTNLVGKDNGGNGIYSLSRRDGTGKDAEKINKIFDLFNDGFRQQKALTALFNGDLGKGLEVVENGTDAEKIINKYKNEEEHITIVFSYNEDQKIKGKASDVYNKDKYRNVCFTITKNNSLQDIILGLPDSSLSFEESENNTDIIAFSQFFRGKMVTGKLYDYVYSLLEPFKK